MPVPQYRLGYEDAADPANESNVVYLTGGMSCSIAFLDAMIEHWPGHPGDRRQRVYSTAARPNAAAFERIESPATIAREISTRSAWLRGRAERRR